MQKFPLTCVSLNMTAQNKVNIGGQKPLRGNHFNEWLN